MNFAEYTERFTDDHASKLASWRGYQPKTLTFLRQQNLIGLTDSNQVCFPTKGGAHFMCKADDPKGRWRYTKGAKAAPFTIGNIEEGAHVHCFESQWDAIALMDATEQAENIVASRGASNARLIIEALPGDNGTKAESTCTLFLWAQNDKAGQQWARDVRKLYKGAVKLVKLPQPFGKDLNEYTKGGATAGDVMKLYLDAQDFEAQPPPDEVSFPSSNSAGVTPAPAENTFGHLPIDDVVGPGDTVVPIAIPPMGTVLVSEAEAGSEKQHPVDVSPALVTDSLVDEPTRQSITVAEILQRPPDPDALTIPGAVVLPVINNLADCLNAIRVFIDKYMSFEEEWQLDIISIWAAYMWVWQAFYTTPYLYIRSPEPSCGKSNLLQILLSLCPNAFGNSIIVNVSESALFRCLNETHPICFIDEVDKHMTDPDSPIMGILNGGYKRGSSVMRCVGNSHGVTSFDVYSPKAFAGVGQKMDATTASRSIHIHMTRQDSGHRKAPLISWNLPAEVAPIKAFLTKWGKDTVEALQTVVPAIPEEIDDGRKIELATPLVVVADQAGSEWSQIGRAAVVEALTQEDESTEGTQILSSIKAVFETKQETRMTSIDLINSLIELEDANAPWAMMWEKDVKNGQTLKPRNKLAKMLKPYNIHPKNLRMKTSEGTSVFKGYEIDQFLAAFSRYLPKTAQSVNMELF